MRSVMMLFGAAMAYVACAVPVDTRPAMKSSPGEHIAGRDLVDAMSDPVPTAEAAAMPTFDVATEDCKPVGALSIAEHLYPGKSLTDLASVRTILHYTNASYLGVPGYENAASGAVIRDGAAAANCTGVFDRVTFILPAQ